MPNPSASIAIVTDGMWRKSLSAIRSLGKAGYRVHVLGETRLTVGFWSRYSARRVLAPDAKENARGFAAALREHVAEVRSEAPAAPRPVLLPMEDETLRVVVEHADELAEDAAFIVPSPDALAVCADKASTMALAERLGIPHPRTEVVETTDALLDAVARAAGAELVLKPLRGSGSRGVRYNPSFGAAEAQTYFEAYGPSVLQERVPAEGDALGISLLFDRSGECIAHFCHRRLQQYPNSGGPSTDRVGVAADALLEMSERLLREIGFTGVAMVEWKIDPRTATPRLMEVNPRFWGSLELAVRSGVDFPVLYARAAAERPEAPPQPTPGVRCRWLVPGDVLRWLTADPKKRESLGVFCRGLPTKAEEWDRTDLRGFFATILCQALAVLRPKYRRMLSR